jgi:hypothetical protein
LKDLNQMKRLLPPLALGLAMFAQPAIAQAVNLTEEEMAVVARVAMPAAFRSLQTKCDPVLDADAYMFARGETLHRRLLATSNTAAPGATQVIARVASRSNPAMGQMLAGLSPEALRPFVNEMVAGLVISRVETDQCARIDRVLEMLEPLPPENLAQLMAFAYTQSQADERVASAAARAR